MNTLSFLDGISASDASSFGEEASVLGTLESAGVSVSPSFSIPSQAYAEFVGKKEVKEVLSRAGEEDEEQFAKDLSSVSLPKRLAQEIERFYRTLSGPQDIKVSLRSEYHEEEAKDPEELLSSVESFWRKHLVSLYEREGNFFKEPLPILVQQVTAGDLKGTLSTSASELGSLDLCLVEVLHEDGKQRVVFEKGSGEVVRRNVLGMVENPASNEELKEFSSWASKMEQILGEPYKLSWVRYHGEFVFEKVKKVYIPQIRSGALELWLNVEEEIPQDTSGVSGFVSPNLSMAMDLAEGFPGEKVLFLLGAQDFSQLEELRIGKHKRGLSNLHLVLPPVRTVDGLREMKRYLSGERIQRGPNFEFYFRVFYPSNVVLLERFLEVGVDGVVFDEKAIAQGMLGTNERVEPDDSLPWAIREATRKVKKEESALLYLGERARSFVLYELVRAGARGIIVPQTKKEEYSEALKEAEQERLSSASG